MTKSPYTDTSQKVRMTYRQFELLNILHLTDFDGAEVFASPSKRTVYLEFDHFVQFLATNLNEEHIILDDSLTDELLVNKNVSAMQNLISVVRAKTHDRAHAVDSIVSDLFKFIKQGVTVKNKVLTPQEVYSSLNQSNRNHFKIKLNRHKDALAELWALFLVHTALMNIKSVIACGEYYQTNMLNKVNVVPMLFIPRIGLLQSIFEVEKFNVDKIQTKIIENSVGEYGMPSIVGTLDENAVEDIYDIRVEGLKSFDEFAIGEIFSLTEERYRVAWDSIISSSLTVVDHIQECEDYMFYFDSVLDLISRLASLTEHFNEKERLFLVDLPML